MKNHSHKKSEHSSATSSSELPWLAFCYVANELDAETRREFEIRLEHDQSAREAVVQEFDGAWMLDQALSAHASPQETGQTQAATCELSQPQSQRSQRSSATKSKRRWPAALLGLSVAGLLAMAAIQLQWKPADVKVAKNPSFAVPSELTNASMSLAETWADSDWDIESAAEIADIETNLAPLDQNDQKQDLVRDDDQDDWMTATLIDMAEEPDSLPLKSGS